MHYTLVFKYRKGREVFTTKHRFLWTARLFSKYLKKKGFRTIVLLRVED